MYPMFNFTTVTSLK